MSRGGANPYRIGRAFENEVIADLEKLGFFCIRSAGSKSPLDIVSIKDGGALGYQCKLRGYISKSERLALQELRDILDMTIYLVWKEDGAIRYEFI